MRDRSTILGRVARCREVIAPGERAKVHGEDPPRRCLNIGETFVQSIGFELLAIE